MAKARQGFKLVESFHQECVVSMIEFKGQVYVATESRVFRLHKSGDKLVPIHFEIESE